MRFPAAPDVDSDQVECPKFNFSAQGVPEKYFQIPRMPRMPERAERRATKKPSTAVNRQRALALIEIMR
jgi:hypothetical protein